ncbi:a-type inclusion protein [Anaeramoeba ignava]|uniref:A-type inclusion protein n=1 Tax=Anaeramoeba ignava TaxID=1746090 RepID=A0A9Q0RBR5_ANAIG|nr:a-type inclusion protein [Anaeramoeba ignava]
MFRKIFGRKKKDQEKPKQDNPKTSGENNKVSKEEPQPQPQAKDMFSGLSMNPQPITPKEPIQTFSTVQNQPNQTRSSFDFLNKTPNKKQNEFQTKNKNENQEKSQEFQSSFSFISSPSKIKTYSTTSESDTPNTQERTRHPIKKSVTKRRHKHKKSPNKTELKEEKNITEQQKSQNLFNMLDIKDESKMEFFQLLQKDMNQTEQKQEPKQEDKTKQKESVDKEQKSADASQEEDDQSIESENKKEQITTTKLEQKNSKDEVKAKQQQKQKEFSIPEPQIHTTKEIEDISSKFAILNTIKTKQQNLIQNQIEIFEEQKKLIQEENQANIYLETNTKLIEELFSKDEFEKIENIQKENENLKQKIKNIRKKDIGNQKKISQSENEKIQQIREEIEIHHKKIQDLTQLRYTKEDQLSEFENASKKVLERLENNMELQKDETNRFKKQLDVDVANLEKLRENLEKKVQNETNELQQKKDEVSNDIKELEENIHTNQETHKEKIAQKQQLETDLQSLNSKLKQIQVEFQDEQKEIEKQKAKLEEQINILKEKEEEYKQLEELNENKKQEISQNKKRFEKELENLEKTIEEFEENFQKMKEISKESEENQKKQKEEILEEMDFYEKQINLEESIALTDQKIEQLTSQFLIANNEVSKIESEIKAEKSSISELETSKQIAINGRNFSQAKEIYTKIQQLQKNCDDLATLLDKNSLQQEQYRQNIEKEKKNQQDLVQQFNSFIMTQNTERKSILEKRISIISEKLKDQNQLNTLDKEILSLKIQVFQSEMQISEPITELKDFSNSILKDNQDDIVESLFLTQDPFLLSGPFMDNLEFFKENDKKLVDFNINEKKNNNNNNNFDNTFNGYIYGSNNYDDQNLFYDGKIENEIPYIPSYNSTESDFLDNSIRFLEEYSIKQHLEKNPETKFILSQKDSENEQKEQTQETNFETILNSIKNISSKIVTGKKNTKKNQRKEERIRKLLEKIIDEETQKFFQAHSRFGERLDKMAELKPELMIGWKKFTFQDFRKTKIPPKKVEISEDIVFFIALCLIDPNSPNFLKDLKSKEKTTRRGLSRFLTKTMEMKNLKLYNHGYMIWGRKNQNPYKY